MVVANALAALQEIQEISGKDMLQLTQHTLNKLLTALNDCTEWGQVRRGQALGGAGRGWEGLGGVRCGSGRGQWSDGRWVAFGRLGRNMVALWLTGRNCPLLLMPKVFI